MNTKAGLLTAAMVLVALAASAHHAGAMFDDQKSVTLTGTVREFQFTNPHCYIQLRVPGTAVTPDEWSVEMGAPAHLMRQGWKRNTLKPGEQLTIVIHPLRDGGKSGSFVSATRSDGSTVGEAL